MRLCALGVPLFGHHSSDTPVHQHSEMYVGTDITDTKSSIFEVFFSSPFIDHLGISETPPVMRGAGHESVLSVTEVRGR